MKKAYTGLIAAFLFAPFMAGAQASNYTAPTAYNEVTASANDNNTNNLKREATARYYKQQQVQNQVDYITGDFGTVRQGESTATFFAIPPGNNTNNTGINVIKAYSDAQSGITYASALKNQPIIEVGFDSKGKSGKISEVVTVHTNRGTYYLKLTGQVDK